MLAGTMIRPRPMDQAADDRRYQDQRRRLHSFRAENISERPRFKWDTTSVTCHRLAACKSVEVINATSTEYQCANHTKFTFNMRDKQAVRDSAMILTRILLSTTHTDVQMIRIDAPVPKPPIVGFRIIQTMLHCMILRELLSPLIVSLIGLQLASRVLVWPRGSIRI